MIDLTDKQLKIIYAAMEIIANSGMQNLSIRNLAKAVKITESTIYCHFKSKEEIVNALIKFFENVIKSDLQKIDYKNILPIEKLEDYFRTFLSYSSTKPELINVYYFGPMYCIDDNLKNLNLLRIYVNNWLLKTIIEGQGKREIRNDIAPEDLSLLIRGATCLLNVQAEKIEADFSKWLMLKRILKK